MTAVPALPVLVDPYQRRIDYLRVSVTDRCDLRCSYCLPEGFKGFEAPEKGLSNEEMTRLVGLFIGLGVRRVRLTGGEPLLRRGLTDLVSGIAAMPGLDDLSLSTNGTRLARQARALKVAGVSRLNVSLDSLNADVMRRITGRDCLADILAGLAGARDAGFSPIKLNAVVQPGSPLDDLRRLLAFAMRECFVLRFIEPMPVGNTGRLAGSVDLSEIGARLAHEFGLIPTLAGGHGGPARYWTTGESAAVLGVITPMSRHFCATCNRVRLGMDGSLYLCLGQEEKVPLGEMLRAGASDQALIAAIMTGIAAKPQRHEFQERPERILRFMAQTGG